MSSPIVTPEPTETTQKERTPSPVDLCTSKIEVKKTKKLTTKGYKLPASMHLFARPLRCLEIRPEAETWGAQANGSSTSDHFHWSPDAKG